MTITEEEFVDPFSTNVEIPNGRQTWNNILTIRRDENPDRSRDRIDSIDKPVPQGIALTDTDQLETVHHKDIERGHSDQIEDHEAKKKERKKVSTEIY